MDWTPHSWRDRPAVQLPDYPDDDALARVEQRLAMVPPLASVADILHLQSQLAQVAAGHAFLLQGGDCAESFAEFTADKVRTTFHLMLQMGATLRAGSGSDIVHLARIAGQFAKPRSADTETIGGVTLPSYRGDAVNGPGFTAVARTPDPERLIDAHRQAQATIDLLKAFSVASYADLPEIYRAVGSSEPPRPVDDVHQPRGASAQLRAGFDPLRRGAANAGGRPPAIWSGSATAPASSTARMSNSRAASPTRSASNAARRSTPTHLLRLIDRLDPDNSPGRLVLIGRFGADNVAAHLPELMRATRREGRHAIWSIDPMHGNTQSAGSLKTRLLRDIVAEITTFFEVARAERVHPGGVHLEMTGADVTECLGGSLPLVEADLPRRYLTHCDPRLNLAQAMDVAAAVAALLGKGQRVTSNAA